MRLNASLLVLGFASATGVVGLPFTISDGDNSATSHQLVRRGWIGNTINFLNKWVPVRTSSLEQIVGLGVLGSLVTIPFAWDVGRKQEREDIERAIAERRRKAYEREENGRRMGGQNGTSNVDGPQESSEDQVQSQDSEPQNQPSPNQSGQAAANQQESPAELRDPPTNYLPPTGVTRSGFDRSESPQRDSDSSPDASSSSNANSDPVSLAGEGLKSGSEDEANPGQPSTTPDDQQETEDQSIEEVSMEENK